MPQFLHLQMQSNMGLLPATGPGLCGAVARWAGRRSCGAVARWAGRRSQGGDVQIRVDGFRAHKTGTPAGF